MSTDDASETPDVLLARLNATFAAWILEQSKSSPNADWSVAALEYSCHVENIRSAFKVEDPRVFKQPLNTVPENNEIKTNNNSPERTKKKNVHRK